MMLETIKTIYNVLKKIAQYLGLYCVEFFNFLKDVLLQQAPFIERFREIGPRIQARQQLFVIHIIQELIQPQNGFQAPFIQPQVLQNLLGPPLDLNLLLHPRPNPDNIPPFERFLQREQAREEEQARVRRMVNQAGGDVFGFFAQRRQEDFFIDPSYDGPFHQPPQDPTQYQEPYETDSQISSDEQMQEPVLR